MKTMLGIENHELLVLKSSFALFETCCQPFCKEKIDKGRITQCGNEATPRQLRHRDN